MSAQQKDKVAPRAWGCLLITWAASIMAPLSQFKVVPLSSMLMAEYGFDISTFGLLMSWMALIGIVLAFPAAFITGKLGPKKSILLCLGFTIVGTLVGALAPNTYVLFFSRVLEGVGLGLMGITAPSAIAVWFPPSRRGFPLGLWSAWVPVGIVLAFNTVPRIAAVFGMRAVWWAALALTVVVAILFALLYKLPNGVSNDEFVVKGSAKEVVRLTASRNIWILAIAFFCFHIVGTNVLNTYYPIFLQGTYEWTAVTASQFTSYHTMLCILTNPLGGWLYEKTRRPKLLLSLGFIILIFGVAICWIPIQGLNFFFICFSALGIGLIAGCCRAFSVELLMPKNPLMATPVAQAVLTFTHRLSDTLIPLVFGAILASGTFVDTNYFTIPMLVLALIMVILIQFKDGSPAPKLDQPAAQSVSQD